MIYNNFYLIFININMKAESEMKCLDIEIDDVNSGTSKCNISDKKDLFAEGGTG